MARGPVAASVARNALSGGGRFVVSAAIALIVTPYALHTLGRDLFGLWALAGALLATTKSLDLGLGRSITRAVADAAGRDDDASAAAQLAAGRVLALLLGIASVLIVWLLIDPIVAGLLRLPVAVQPLARQVLIGTAIVAAIDGAFAPFSAALDGTGRMDISNGIDTVQRVLSGIGTVLVLALGWGLLGLVAKNLVTALLAGAAYAYAVGRASAPLMSKRLRWDPATMRDLLAFGGHVQAVAVSALVMDVGGKIVLGRGHGLYGVANYELALRVVTQAGGATIAMAMALFPAAAHAGAGRGPNRVESMAALYGAGTRRLGWLAFPMFAMLVALSEPFVGAWLGPGFTRVALAMQVLAMGWLVASLAIPAHLFAQAGGHPRVSVAGGVATTAIALTTSILWVGSHGLIGVAGGVAVGLAAGAAVVWLGLAAALGTGWAAVTVLGWRAPLAAALGSGSAWAVMRAFAVAAPTRPETLLQVAVAAALGLMVYGTALVLSGEATREDWHTLKAALGRASNDSAEPSDSPHPDESGGESSCGGDG